MENNRSIIGSVQNFRELGGILIGDKTVRYGKIYRCGALDKLSIEDKQIFDGFGIRYIFDYRSEYEAAASPDYTSSAQYFHLPALAEMPGKKAMSKIKKSSSKDAYSTIPADMSSAMKLVIAIPFLKNKLASDFRKMYTKLPFGNKAYSETFSKLDEGETILFHCQSGKDRTGVASAIILLALGADEETIVKDYMLSNSCRQKENDDAISQVFEATHSKKAVQIIKTVMFTQEEYILKSLSSIKKRYGTYNEFLLNEYGIDGARITKWRKYYLTDNKG